jgi:uncharacterized membrane protein
MMFWMMRMPMSRKSEPTLERPLDILQRRYASGEMTAVDYEESLRRLQRNDEVSRMKISDAFNDGSD